MISDDSSSDSETGRFKSSSNKTEDNDVRPRHSVRGSDRSHREVDRKRDDPNQPQTRNRHRFSPLRRRSRERDHRHPRFNDRHNSSQNSKTHSRTRGHRSRSRDGKRHSRSRSHKSPERQRDLRHEIRQAISSRKPDKYLHSTDKDKRTKRSPSLELKDKKSVVHRPKVESPPKKKSTSPIHDLDDLSDESEEVQLGSYYNNKPAVIKEKSDDSSQSDYSSDIDSSDDEKLRAKLLNADKSGQKKKKKKSKRKHKKRTDREVEGVIPSNDTNSAVKKTDKEIEGIVPSNDINSAVNVDKNDEAIKGDEKAKESSEEGEIQSGESQNSDDGIDPSDLRHKLKRSKNGKSSEGSQDSTSQRLDVCGPALPPSLAKKFRKSSSPEVVGCALPPHLKKNIGPSIPEDMRKVLAENDRKQVVYHSSDDEGIGPLPSGAEHKWTDAHERLEERALDYKLKKLGESNSGAEVKSREKWMLELPEGKAKYLGLEARSFRAKEGPDMSDRSSWTDTPEQKAKKAAGVVEDEDYSTTLKREARAKHMAARDQSQEEAVKSHKKKHKRDESLLDLHQKKLKKKKKKKDDKDDDKKERRPFSRDVDLQTNKFDEAQKKAIIKKAQDLNSRFSKGEAKYL